MKLAEALIERKALKEKLARLPLRLCATAGAVYGRRGLRQRLVVNAKVQEGDQPQQDPRDLLSEVEETLTALQRLIVQINRTNIETVLREGERATLMDAIAQRDSLALKREILQLAANSATITRERGFVTRSEIRFRATLEVAALQVEIDANAKGSRELDAQIQARNFTTELLE